PGGLPAAAPLVAAWALAPAASWWLSRPTVPPRPALTAGEQAFLHRVTRRTWRFFATFVSAEDNWLPPDNVQEDPPRGVAHRTSPTNIGLSLTASLAAYDFGHLTASELIERTRRTLATIDRMEKYRGHLYNWYETTTLAPLPPTYVSTVDSANLAGNLLVLAAGLDELHQAPAARPAIARALATTLELVAEQAPAGEAARAIAKLRPLLATPPRTPPEATAMLARVVPEAEALVKAIEARGDAEAVAWAQAFLAQARAHLDELEHLAHEDPAVAAARTDERARDLTYLAARCRELADLDYDFLYDADRHLLSIGYSVANHRLDASSYDLLASEARLASFLAIAQGKLPQEHWFSLGRQLTSVRGRQALLSWSGSMFEYLMPLLLMRTYDGTLLDDTYRAVVDSQIAYGRERGVPWGVSESGYYKLDAQRNYQYRAFGVPGLGFKRGLADDLVISPYSTAMALMVAPRAAAANLERLVGEGQLGPHGFYEAIDYTPGRLPSGAERVTVKSFMAHHQGMTMLSLAYVLLDRPMQRRFAADPAVRATELLLQERVPRAPAITPHPAEVATMITAAAEGEHDLRVFTSPSTRAPEVHLLSNGTYHVAITAAGGGYSRWKDVAVTRWHEDPTRDAWGAFGYLRDVDSGRFWSVAHQPTLVRAERYEAIYSAGRAEFRRTDASIETHVEIAVSPEDDVELRRVTLCNRGKVARTIELTSYAEVVMTQAAADAAHPAFSNLFVQTELVRDHQAILATRRPRSGDEQPPWMFHLIVVDGTAAGEVSYETSRAAFVGRCRTPCDPLALYRERLGDSAGSVLDPIVALRGRLTLAPDETARFHLATGVAEARDGALRLIEKYRDRHAPDRLLELARTHSRVVQRHVEASNLDIQLYERLAGSVLYANPTLRAPRSVIARNRVGQAGLWPYAISGDLPIVLVRIADVARIELVRHLVKAHTYWRLKGLSADLVIWNEDPSGYRQVLQDEIMSVIGAVADAALLDKPGGIFVRRSEQISEDDKVLMQTVARVIVSDTAGSLGEHLDRKARTEPFAGLVPGADKLAAAPLQVRPVATAPAERTDLAAWNGFGGFSRAGDEYVIVTSRDRPTPAPWCNVLANPWFGTVVSESGGAYTWCENAQSYRLTPWHNDAVGDASGEAFYLRDEEDGRVWSPTPLPAPADAGYVSRHGFGYSVFEVTHGGIASELTVFVAADAPVKFGAFRLRNLSGRARRISITGYAELVLGTSQAAQRPHVVTELDGRSRGLLGRNAYNSELAARVAFLDCSEDARSVTGDRTAFLGRNGTPARPVGLAATRLSGTVGAGYDPCLAMQTVVELADGQEREVVFTFGSGRDLADARNLIQRFRGTGPARAALEGVRGHWRRTLGAVTVRTPEPALDVLANGWLLYQVLGCRLWARSGFYQSGGAFGFRDQLQDAMALVHAEPALLREQLLRAAARQFPQGDVQHWWHPPQGRGVRTHISDDYLWLPYAVARYVTAIGDTGVLDVRVGFIEGRQVKDDEESYYDLPARSEESATLYDHCVRAIEHGLRFGAHGLPLMGAGDWNDGMNLVGAHGKGESVWLAFFLHDVLVQFGGLAKARGDVAFAGRCEESARALEAAIADHAWDGAWYRRAYFDDGTPLGSAENDECKIDSLPQSWAVLAGVGDPARARQALAEVDARLVRRDLGLVQLFEPAFDRSALRPGYIKGYVPGVRENGGQYTHAAVWAVMAFAAAGERERAWELFGMINPVHHGDSPRAIGVYQVEPYVVAADVYTNPQHAGRGGWTWYTGSAGWMYRLVVESLLGLRLDVEKLWIEPLVPAGWDGFEVEYRYRETRYHLRVRDRTGATRVVVDGVEQPEPCVPLRDDYREHEVVVELDLAAPRVRREPGGPREQGAAGSK
ncbi:MAG TPA: glucoamylase family protein, partial [Kofleriaceae bacterium]|nr:glucoamylase family protein [Kofleriaceae bacterium]